ncbi:hypothetical protein L195_g018463 [Trifolium pratense]|uniref:Uncharacterized protein n=3 Tax=Trifolium pratense TaxID=57577 RepID=A0ACB0IFC5_TRIPR|nr:uncharacterized protein LOC123900955 [Trifolium pratense]PNX95273.1 hypothetical protein L195_g018463 [Trifolium pratense]CAJ2630695.1 unnamed protein product [Trifolium pratense]
MVFSGEEEKNTMGTGSGGERVKHNFMLPCLKWGTQRHLRCMKIPSGDGSPSNGTRSEIEPSQNNARNRIITKPRINGGGNDEDDDDGDDGIGAVREKLMLDLKTQTARMKDVILGKDEENGDAAGEGSMAGEKTWNLRTRRGAAGETGKGLKIDDKKPNGSPLRNFNGGGKLRGGGGSPEKVKFSLTLTKKEIEEDFLKMTGHRPPRRPTKRPRNVQKHMDTIFPGMWLSSEVTPDLYKVPDDSETGKK